MPSELNSYRLLNRLDFAPSFTSLGLRPELFRDGGDIDATGFDAAMSAPNNLLWLFRGEDFLCYDLRQDKIVRSPSPIAQGWAGGALPGSFNLGVDSALWAGPGFPNIACLFRGPDYVKLDCAANPTEPQSWRVTQGPWGTNREWLRLPSTDGRPHRGPDLEPCVKLHGLREAANRVHFFTRDGRYARHNLMNGEYDIPPCATIEHFPLPEHFASRVDLAFYGAGAEAEHIFFFCRQDFAEFDIRRGVVVRSGAIEQRFPALAGLLARPQFFLVEDYALDTYVGPLAFGRLVSTMQIPPQSRRTSTVVTRVTVPASIGLKQNLIERQSSESIADFYTRIAAVPPPTSRVEAGAALWSGEVDALGDGDPLDGRRDALVQTAFAALAEQVRQSSHQIEQRVVDAATDVTSGEVLNRETFELANTSASTRQIEFVELLQTYATLMVLTNVRLAYTNGRDRAVPFALREIDARLLELLADPANAAPIVAYLKAELERIQDSSGEMRSFLIPGARLDVDARVRSGFTFEDVRPPQVLELSGIVKAARTWRQPTYQTRAIDVAQEGPTELPLTEIVPVAVAPQPEIAAFIEEIQSERAQARGALTR